MTVKPSFELMAVDLTETEFQSELTNIRANTGKFFKPGKYDLVVKKAEWHKVNQHDESWFGLQIVLGDNVSERQVRQYLSVPTKSVRYNKPGVKNPLGLFMMFREFVEALGLECQIEHVPSVLKDVFGDLETGLVGRTLNVTIGYKAPYIERIGDGQFKVLEKDGRDYKFEGETPIFSDRESAVAEVQIKYGLDLSRSYPEIIKLNKPELNDDF